MNCDEINLYSICKRKHDKNHKIIKFEENDICNKQYEIYTKYCKECKMNICIECVNNMNYHSRIHH